MLGNMSLSSDLILLPSLYIHIQTCFQKRGDLIISPKLYVRTLVFLKFLIIKSIEDMSSKKSKFQGLPQLWTQTVIIQATKSNTIYFHKTIIGPYLTLMYYRFCRSIFVIQTHFCYMYIIFVCFASKGNTKKFKSHRESKLIPKQ